ADHGATDSAARRSLANVLALVMGIEIRAVFARHITRDQADVAARHAGLDQLVYGFACIFQFVIQSNNGFHVYLLSICRCSLFQGAARVSLVNHTSHTRRESCPSQWANSLP